MKIISLGFALAAFLALASPALASNRGGIGAPMSDGPRIVYEDTWARHVRGRVPRSELAFHVPHFERDAPGVAVRAAWGVGVRVYASGSALVNEAARYVGSGNFTGLREAWCADAVNIWLRNTGRPPLRGRMAGDALAYGPRGSGAPGDLAVFLNRRGYAYHVGVVSADLGGQVEVISGNWSHRVARAVVPRWGLVFIRT